MRRDSRLRGLSSDHHQALVLARALAEAEVFTEADGARLAERFERELEPHFRVEEELLLPALSSAGEPALVARTLADHAFMREIARDARSGDLVAARELGRRLHEHVRFEERELFPACEARLSSELLDEVWARAPKTG